MYMNTSAVGLAARPRHERKPALGIQPLLTVLALSCLLLFAANGVAQQNNTINTVAGGAPTNSVATLAAIPNPTGVAEDASGNIYVAAQYSYYVYKINPSTGALSIFAGTGIFGFSGDGGPATSAALTAPVAVAVDNTSGKVYIVDNNRIRVVTPDGNINTFANPTGAQCIPNVAACGDYGPANSSKVLFYQPEGLYVDGSGNLFISDTGDDRVRFINNQASAITVAGISVAAGDIITVAGNGLTCNGPTQPCGDGYSSIAPQNSPNDPSGARLDLAVGVATDSSGNIYIGDTRDQRIRCVVNVAGGCPNTAYPNPAVGEIVTYAGSGSYCPTPTNSCNDGQAPLKAEFHNPAGVWVDATGNLYVADQWDNKIRMVTVANCPQGTPCVTTLAGTGAPSFGGDGGKASKAALDGPLAVILDSAGNMTIADSGNGRVRQVVNSVINTKAGGGSIGDGGQSTAAELADPVTIAWGPTGTNYYIADSANNRIREVTANGTISTVAGDGLPSVWQLLEWGDGGSAVQATLLNPNGVAVDAAGNLYIADSGDSVVRAVNMQATPVTLLNITIQPGDIATVAGSGLSCENPTGVCGDGQPATAAGARITYPAALTLDSHGNLYIADLYDNRVREVLAVAGNCGAYPGLKVGDICTLAGTGTVGNTGDNGPATKALLHYPYGLAADNGGDVYIADSVNNRIRCVIGTLGGCGGSALPVGDIVPYAFTGKASYSGNNGPATAATRAIPQELAIDPAGDLFVSGGAVLSVQRIDATSRWLITVAGNPSSPTAGFAGDGGPSTKAKLDNLGVAVNGAGNLLIDDQGNNRIREVDMVPVAQLVNTKLTFPATPVGQTSAPMTAKLANSGLAELSLGTTLLGGADPGDFAVVGNTCVTQLSPLTECSVSVTFTPTKTGSRTATLTINTGLGAENVKLVGTGQ
jgi:trimeric autotransporter adhesin